MTRSYIKLLMILDGFMDLCFFKNGSLCFYFAVFMSQNLLVHFNCCNNVKGQL